MLWHSKADITCNSRSRGLEQFEVTITRTRVSAFGSSARACTLQAVLLCSAASLGSRSSAATLQAE